MIDTGGTLAAAAQTVMDEGATRGLRGRNPRRLLRQRVREPRPTRRCSGIVVTDTIPLRDGAPDMITVISTADILTDSIRKIFTDESVCEIFAGENQLF